MSSWLRSPSIGPDEWNLPAQVQKVPFPDLLAGKSLHVATIGPSLHHPTEAYPSTQESGYTVVNIEPEITEAAIGPMTEAGPETEAVAAAAAPRFHSAFREGKKRKKFEREFKGLITKRVEMKKKEMELQMKEEEELQKYIPLYKATLVGDWNNAERIFREYKNSLTSSIAFTTETALHAAIGTGKNIDFVQKLIEIMPDDLLDIKVKDDVTPLHVAALSGNTKAAKMLVGRRSNLLYERTHAGLLPIHFAAESGHWETLAYLISVTDNQHDVYSDQSGLKLLLYTIDAGFYDVALDMVKKYPSLAILRDVEDGSSALQKMVGKVYVFSRPIRNFTRLFLCQNKDRMRKQALELVKNLCKNINSKGNDSEAKSIYSAAMMDALDAGASEAIQIILHEFPEAVITTMRNREAYVFGLAVENRCEIVFHLIFQTSSLNQRRCLGHLDYMGNNVLHRTAKLAPKHKLNHIPGAALQMQREMQWYKEMENLVDPRTREARNYDDETPWMIFTRAHESLKSDGEKWIKGTANSCSIIAALIATIVFAAAITVPGGNKDESGLPFFSTEIAFILFAVSDAISLFASMVSLLMFLAIITSRFAEEDFLYDLPKRLSICLISVFTSILFMMIAFGATFYIVFGQKKPLIVIPVICLLSCFPITCFAYLQASLLFDVISNTYGAGSLGKQIKKFQN